VLARQFEAAGLVTMSISLVREHSAMIKPPRALWVPFPFGMPIGHSGDVAQQRRVLQGVFAMLEETVPVLKDLTGEEDGDDLPGPVQASSVPGPEAGVGRDVAGEVSEMRRYQERWLARGGRTAVGLTGVEPRRFRGLVRFLESYAAGEPADHRERPENISVPYFVRYGVDDLKALYVEARFVMRPEDDNEAVQRWLWGGTALSRLIRELRDRMEASDDDTTQKLAFGLAR